MFFFNSVSLWKIAINKILSVKLLGRTPSEDQRLQCGRNKKQNKKKYNWGAKERERDHLTNEYILKKKKTTG